MAYLFPFPPDAHQRPQRDEDGLAAARGPVQRRMSPMDGTSIPAEQQLVDGSGELLSPAQTAPPRRQIAFADPVAFRYLEDDSCVTVVERRGELHGYESYLVEQWACSRQSPTLVIVTYTGDQKHSVVVGVLAVPVDDSLWSAKLRMYFKAIQKFHARPKETPLGELMVTNLSSFPSALTVIPVPDGDVRKHRQTFIVNEDLKRLGCSGRSGLTLTEPAEATQAKFQQLYKTSDRVPLCQAVMELIKLCQVALYMFEKLDHEYIDGLLCDMTETAVNNWWIEVGAEHYNFEPTDGILGPSTVSALLGMFMGARNRLHWYGAPVSKDVFDIDNTKRGIGHFQKSQKLEKTRRLDRQTLLKLYSASAKAAAGEGWGVQRAVKSTVTEIGGKRGEIVMGMVSGKDKGGLADIETFDIDMFISLVYGERAKWLWHGKPRRTPAEQPDHEPESVNAMVWKDDSAISDAKRIQSVPVEDEMEIKRNEESPGIYSAFPPGSAVSINEGSGDRDALRKGVFKSVAGKMNDTRSGFGRIKDAIGGGRRGHNSRPSVSTREDYTDASGISSAAHNSSMGSTPAFQGVPRAFTWKNKPEEYLAAMKRGDPDVLPGLPETSRYASTSTIDFRQQEEIQKRLEEEAEIAEFGTEVRKSVLAEAPSAVVSLVDENDLQGPLLDAERNSDNKRPDLSRRHSLDTCEPPKKQILNENRWPRRMSFSDAEEAVLTWDEIVDITGPAEDFFTLDAVSEIAHHFNHQIDDITNGIEPWVSEKLKAVEHLNSCYSQDNEALQALYQQLNEASQRVQMSSDELLAEQREHMTENVKELEVLGARLDYEINALLGKVMDVEDGIVSFERQVDDMEKRAADLKVQLETEGWLHWLVRTVTGIGTGPNITRLTHQGPKF
ncbi:Fc.00g020660.m01.CDS01 [Cosmosporella sp. VM-42]